MTNIYDVSQNELIENIASDLKNNDNLVVPSWALFVRTGVSKQRPPVREDWWYVRAASVLLKLNKYGPIGVSKLRTGYGSKKNRGVKPEKFFKGSGNIIRKILQQLEVAGLANQVQIGVHKGRILTAQGKKYVDGFAAKAVSKKEKPVVKEAAHKAEKIEDKKSE